MCLPIIKHDIMNGKTINFNVLKKSSPGYEITVTYLWLIFFDFKNSPGIKHQKKFMH